MSDLRPLGSEKLQGLDKIKRMIDIASKYLLFFINNIEKTIMHK